jgi:ribosomal-protein-alanine N-acetyltransferase
MKGILETDRLLLTKTTLEHAPFIYELVNTPSWIKYIGQRNIKTIQDAEKYIEKLLSNSNITYWVVQLKSSNMELGLITLIKRDYLDNYDIGFAFMPQHANKGYAFEATKEVLNYAITELKIQVIVAITIQENVHSIRLLEKLGFHFEKRMVKEKEELLVYTNRTNKTEIN